MDTQYYVANDGKTLGPYTVDEIIRKIHNGALRITDYIYLQDDKDWIALVDYPPVSERVKTTSGKVHQNTMTASGMAQERDGDWQSESMGRSEEEEEIEWFVLKGDNKYGPYAMGEIVKMLQEKEIYEFDYVWNKGLMNWKRIAELQEFSAKEIRKLPTAEDDEDVFFRRRHARTEYKCSIIVHNNQKVWKGKGLEISAGGAGMEMESDVFEPGQTIYLHFQPGEGVPAFNAACEIISKRVLTGGEKQTFRYGVKFKSIGRQARKIIYEHAQAQAEAQGLPEDKKVAA